MSGRLSGLAAVVVLAALTAWAATAGSGEEPPVEHPSPATVEHVEGSDASVVVLTSAGAEKIGLEVATVERVAGAAGRTSVPVSSLVYGADGTTWVYVSDGDPLRFRRQEVEVAAVRGGRALLVSGAAVGTTIAGAGSAELYGTEFEVGH